MSPKNWSPDNKIPPASPVRKSREENSGLIDLKALMEQAEQQEKEANQALHVSQHIGVYPFGAPPSTRSPSASPATFTPLATSAPIVEQASFSSSSLRGGRGGRSGRARMWAGVLAGTIIGGSAVAAAAISARGLSEKPLQVAEAALTSYVVERGWGPVRAQAVAAEEAALQAKGKGTANAAGGQELLAAGAASDRAAKVGQHVPKAPVMNRTPGTSSPATQAPTTAAPKPAAADPCKGDLMCAMQRAAKGKSSPK